jgi:hypothetical protein
MLQDRAVDSAEESFRVAVHLILFRAVAMVNCRPSGSAVRGNGEMRLCQFLAKHLGDSPRDALGQLDLVKGVAVAFEELDFPPVQTKDLVAVGRLEDANEGLRVEAVGRDSQLGDRPLEFVNSEYAQRAKHSQAVNGVIPEVAILGQNLERLQERLDLTRRVLLP